MRLCIIQDDLEDWERESLNRRRIYQDAFLTIAATAAKNCDSGLIQRVDSSWMDGYGDNGHSSRSIRLGSINSLQGNSPLETRAWILQEDLLARRVLCFAQPQLFWRCKKTVRSEDGFLDGIKWEESNLVKTRNKFVHVDSDNSEDVYEIWRRLSETYSVRNLTFEKDKLPALAGITLYSKELHGDEPIVGLWRDDFVPGLLWEAVPKHVEPKDSIQGASSWSWMSLPGRISYAPSWVIGDESDGSYYRSRA